MSLTLTETKAMEVARRLRSLYPDSRCALAHSSAFQLLVATILSAQCTDVRVNQVTPMLFRKYKGANELAKARLTDLQRIIRSTGFFRNKARNLRSMARVLVEKFQGQVPSTMKELLELPGVARKTANVVLGTWFNQASGVVVDTHVRRIAGLLGLTRHEEPKRIEVDLMKQLPRDEWIDFSHNLIWHGRKVCIARRPRCADCRMSDLCPSAFHVERTQGRA